MEENKSRGKYIGQGILVVILCLIMLIVKLVQPFGVVLQALPEAWLDFTALILYAVIAFTLITVICCHFIFGWTFRELGMTKFKENIGMFILNFIFLAGCVGVTFFTSQMSRTLEFDGLKILLSIIGNFIAIAFVDEVIFRGYLLSNFERLFSKKSALSGCLGSLVIGSIYACTFIPQTIMSLNNVSFMTLVAALAIPFGLGIYLSLIYHLTGNLWVCTAINGVWLSLGSLQADFFSKVFYGVYFGFMVVYLVWSLINSGAKDDEEDGNDDEAALVIEQDIEQQMPQLPEDEQQAVEEKIEEKVEMSHETIEHKEQVVDIPFFEKMQQEAYERESIANASEEESRADDELEYTVMISAVSEQTRSDQVQKAEPIKSERPSEDVTVASTEIDALEQTTVMPAISEALEKTTVMPAISEALEKTTVMPAISEALEKTTVMPAISEALEKTTVMPAVSDALEKTTVMPAVTDALEKTTVMPAVTEALEKTTVMPAVSDALEKTTVMSAVTDALEKTTVMPAVTEALEKTAVMSAITDESEKKSSASELPKGAKVIPFSTRGKQVEKMEKIARPQVKEASSNENPKLRVKAEPNYISHLEKYLGDFEGIFRQMTPTDPPIDIMFFKGPRYNALVTNGMRSMPITLPPELGDYQQLELMMFLDKSIEITDNNIEDEENAWLIKLLVDLALFPKETGSYLGVGHIVGNGEALEPYYPDSKYCGALIFPPMEQENVKFYRYVEKGNTIYIHNVMPLFKDELRFIQEHSADQFINLMSELGVRQIIKRQRVNVISAMNEENK